MRYLIALVVALALPASAVAMSQTTADRRASAAVEQGTHGIAALVSHMRSASSGDKQRIWLGLRRAGRVYRQVYYNGRRVSAAALRPGCRRSEFSVQENVAMLFYTFGWVKTTLHGFCWNGRRITSSGGETTERWSGPLNCWTNTSDGDVWTYIPTWRRAFAHGQLGAGANSIACGGLQSVSVSIDYANGGGTWLHHS